MQLEKFNEVHEEIIKPLIRELMDDQYNKCNKCLSLKKDYDKKIYKQYEKLRKEIKRRDMYAEVEYIDRHKIGACMMGAIVLVSPISVKTTLQDIPERMIFANEGLGFYTAICMLESFLEEENLKIYYPNVDSDMDADMPIYVRNTCIDLFKAKLEHRYSVLTFSNVLFLLEELSKKIC